MHAPTAWTSKLDWSPIPSGLLLFVLIPLVVLALPLALFRVTTGSDVSLVLSLYFWSATVMIGWLSAALGSMFLYWICTPLRPPLWVICLFGPILAGLVFHAPIIEILSLASSFQADPGIKHAPDAISLSWEFAGKFILNLTPGTIIWMATNYAFDRILGIPRYRYAQTNDRTYDADLPEPRVADGGVDVALPTLVARLPQSERGQIVAIKAEDHYVRIYTDAGDGLALLRLRDAIKMARPTTGLQVHRSSWVADRAIKNFRRTGHTGTLYLTNGLEIQVSRSFCGDVERRLQQSVFPAANGSDSGITG